MPRPLPDTAVPIVHYINQEETSTLCGLEKKTAHGPKWVIPGKPDSKKYVDCSCCIQTHAQQKNPS